MNNMFLLIIGMAIVTYIPRMLPMLLLSEIELPTFLKRFLKFIPYTALSALIFPEILYSTDSLQSAIFGGIIAIILALFNTNLLLIVLSGISGVFLWEILLK